MLSHTSHQSLDYYFNPILDLLYIQFLLHDPLLWPFGCYQRRAISSLILPLSLFILISPWVFSAWSRPLALKVLSRAYRVTLEVWFKIWPSSWMYFNFYFLFFDTYFSFIFLCMIPCSGPSGAIWDMLLSNLWGMIQQLAIISCFYFHTYLAIWIDQS